MITYGSRPLSPAIHCTFLHIVLRCFMQFIEKIAYRFPIHQISGTHHRRTRHQVHGRAHHIKIITHTNHIGVGHISPDHRILKRYSLHFQKPPPRSKPQQKMPRRMPTAISIFYFVSSFILLYILRYKTIILKTSNNRSTSTFRVGCLCK